MPLVALCPWFHPGRSKPRRWCRCSSVYRGLVLLVAVLLVMLALANHVLTQLMATSGDCSTPTKAGKAAVHLAPFPRLYHSVKAVKHKSLLDAVRERMLDSTIVIAIVDESFIDMAFNFYESSILKHSILNFLFISLSKSCVVFTSHNMPCYELKHKGEDLDHDSIFGSNAFNRKVHMRTEIILTILRADINVLSTDTDVAFMQNPMPYLHDEHCDIQALPDGSDHYLNAGFMKFTPKDIVKHMVQEIVNLINKDTNLVRGEQGIVNQALQMFKNVTACPLDKRRFVCGGCYYTGVPPRYFIGDNPCTECVVVHNNHIVTKEAKVYRFKETGMWVYDTDGYYSDFDRKYLMYDNPRTSDMWLVLLHQRTSLRNALALGRMLNRTVILPKFYSGFALYECPMNCQFAIKNFDDVFAGFYREHSFLENPKVPSSIKHDIEGPIDLIPDSWRTVISGTEPKDVALVRISSAYPNAVEIQNLLRIYQNKAVLHFLSLNRVHPQFSKRDENEQFKCDIENSVYFDYYWQYWTYNRYVKGTW